jgi:hypothetical protein
MYRYSEIIGLFNEKNMQTKLRTFTYNKNNVFLITETIKFPIIKPADVAEVTVIAAVVQREGVVRVSGRQILNATNLRRKKTFNFW